MKKVSSFGAAFLMATALVSFQSKPSHAVLGLATGDPVMAVLGILTTTAGLTLKSGGNVEVNNGMLTAIGIFLLDNTTSSEFSFSALTPAQASELNVSDADLSIYNNELDQLNAVSATIAKDVTALEQAGKSDEEVLARSSQLWISYASAVSAETYSTAQKIVQKAFSK